jgi:hypothetical protein
MVKSVPRDIPIELLDRYSMNGKIRVRYLYYDNSYLPEQPLIYKKQEINECITRAKANEVFVYGKTDTWLYQALQKYGIEKKKVAILGSDKPRYESICLSYGGMPATIEYNRIISEDSRLQTMTPDEYSKNPITFDAAFSISSFEHYGLGRYGDPLNPDGDIKAISNAKAMIKEKGLLFLAVPIGLDTLVWNAHRIYGRIRLPILLKNWKLLDVFGIETLMFHADFGTGHGLQPVFVLSNERSSRPTMLYLNYLYIKEKISRRIRNLWLK